MFNTNTKTMELVVVTRFTYPNDSVLIHPRNVEKHHYKLCTYAWKKYFMRSYNTKVHSIYKKKNITASTWFKCVLL